MAGVDGQTRVWTSRRAGEREREDKRVAELHSEKSTDPLNRSLFVSGQVRGSLFPRPTKTPRPLYYVPIGGPFGGVRGGTGLTLLEAQKLSIRYLHKVPFLEQAGTFDSLCTKQMFYVVSLLLVHERLSETTRRNGSFSR